ncbi:MAG: hypothetical protein D6679_12560, partial [Candidatus Hydrogenedentota bacterium]
MLKKAKGKEERGKEKSNATFRRAEANEAMEGRASLCALVFARTSVLPCACTYAFPPRSPARQPLPLPLPLPLP